MTNIPRRLIYEKMLEYEDIVLELHILLISDKNFKKYLNKFNLRIKELKNIYNTIKILFVFFLENRKYINPRDLEKDLKNNLKKIEVIEKIIFNNPNIKKKLIGSIKNLNSILNNLNKIKTIQEGKQLFKALDEFNSSIPKLLEIRRDKMK